MSETSQLNLPLLSPSQAQKHVTVNEALMRLDGLVQLRLASVSQTVPPSAPMEGACYGVPAGAVNDWQGEEGKIALHVNGGWEFVQPRAGFRAVILDQGALAMHDGLDWRAGAVTLTQSGAGMAMRSVETEVAVTPGAAFSTPVIFPDRAIVFGVTGRVTEAITGATSWSLGVAGDPARYGSGLGVGLNSYVSGPGSPLVYWLPTVLEVTAAGGGFTGGTILLAAHYAELSVPNAV